MGTELEEGGDTFGFEGDILRLLKNSTDLSGIRIDKIRFGDKNFSLVRYSLESLEELRAHVHPQELAIRMCGYHGGVIPK